jgi:zona occludens toxin (predicted ATPase)
MIVAFTGLGGSGKTYYMAKMLMEEMKRGRRVFANFPLSGAHQFERMDQIFTVQKGIIAIDELNMLCPARLWHKIPTEYLKLWTQSRKNGVDLYYTSQSFKRVDVSVRTVTNLVYHMKRVFARLHKARLFDASDVEFGRMSDKRCLDSWHFLIHKKIYQKYDTYFQVNPSGYAKSDVDIESSNPLDLPICKDLAPLVGIEKISTSTAVLDALDDAERKWQAKLAKCAKDVGHRLWGDAKNDADN